MYNNYKFYRISSLTNHSLVKCSFCNDVLRLEQRSIRYQNQWFHEDCFKKKTISVEKSDQKSTHDTKKPSPLLPSNVYRAIIISEQIHEATKKPSSVSQNLLPGASIAQSRTPNPLPVITQNKSTLSKQTENISEKKQPIVDYKNKKNHSMLVYPILVVMASILAFFVYVNHGVLYERFVVGFLKWILSLGFWDVVAITAFTVAIDILRNIVKCGILLSHALWQKIKPPKLDEITNPKISVLVPAHNESAAIRNTIMSLLESNYQNKEIIVIDDHSTDDTYERAFPFYRDGRIKLIRRKDGIGSKTMAINYGLLFATGDVIVVTDGDTLLERNALSEVAKRITLPQNIAISGNVRILAGDGGIKNLLTRCQSYEYLIAFELGRRYNALVNMLIIIPGAFSVLMKNTMKSVGLYDTNTLTEDFDLTLKLLKTGDKIEFVPNAVAWTYCPNNWKTWIRQRIRWSHGQIRTLLKHKNIETASYFRRAFVLAIYDMIFMDIVLLLVRVAGVIWLALNYADSIIYVYVLIYALYFVNEAIVISTSAILSPYKRDLKYVYLAPFVVTIYRPLYTYVRFYGYIKSMLKKDTKW